MLAVCIMQLLSVNQCFLVSCHLVSTLVVVIKQLARISISVFQSVADEIMLECFLTFSSISEVRADNFE